MCVSFAEELALLLVQEAALARISAVHRSQKAKAATAKKA